jgi:hypothetical protein
MNTKQSVYNILASINSEPINVELGAFDKQGAADRDKAFTAASTARDFVAKAKANLDKSLLAHKSQLSAYDKWISGLQKQVDNLPVTGNKTTDESRKKAAEFNVTDAKKQRDLMERQMKEVQKMISDLASFKLY